MQDPVHPSNRSADSRLRPASTDPIHPSNRPSHSVLAPEKRARRFRGQTVGRERKLPEFIDADRRRLLRGRRVDVFAALGFGLVAALLVRALVLQISYIPSESMLPTLEVGDRVLVSRISYKVGDIKRGDIVVFKPTHTIIDALGGQKDELIKRVIGLPGDEVGFVEGGVTINGRPLREPWLPEGTITFFDQPSILVPSDHVWLMGDNRGNSADSRVFGAVPTKQIVGRAIFVIWPPTHIGPIGAEPDAAVPPSTTPTTGVSGPAGADVGVGAAPPEP